MGKGTKVRVLETPEQDDSCPLLVESCRLRLALLTMTGDNTYEELLTRCSPGRALVSIGFIRTRSQRCVWLPLQRILVSRLGRGQADTMWPKVLRINPIVGRDYLTGPRPPGKEDTLIRQDIASA